MGENKKKQRKSAKSAKFEKRLEKKSTSRAFASRAKNNIPSGIMYTHCDV